MSAETLRKAAERLRMEAGLTDYVTHREMRDDLGLALADWLEQEASHEDYGAMWSESHPAIVLAHLILGGDS